MNESGIKRSCYNCVHLKVCYYFRTVVDIKWKFNIDTDSAPGKWLDIFESIGGACLQYEPEKSE